MPTPGSDKRDPKLCHHCGDAWIDHDREPLKEHTVILLAGDEYDVTDTLISLGTIMANAAQMTAEGEDPKIVWGYLMFYADVVAEALKRREKIAALRQEHGR